MKRVIIVGSGLSGSYLAYLLQDKCDVTLITKGDIHASNSMLAQGGIAACIKECDSFDSHVKDTMIAGANVNDENRVKKLVVDGATALKDLISLGLEFDKNEDGEIVFGLEGAHSTNRVLHINGDQSGKYITLFVQSLWNNVKVIENSCVFDFIIGDCGQVCGVKYFNELGEVRTKESDVVVLATGGVGQMFLKTTNDTTISGDGIAMCIRNGFDTLDLEFMQFHPTLLNSGDRSHALLSEALRGAGATLVLENGVSIMDGVHPLKDLAPRDVVSREVNKHLCQGENVFLDLSNVDNLQDKFPSIYKSLIEYDKSVVETMLAPVCPGAHFLMGGIKVNDFCQTNVQNLFAIGESSCTRVHGANRLASNSLLECLAFGKTTSEKILQLSVNVKNCPKKVSNSAKVNLPEKGLLLSKIWDCLAVVKDESKINEYLSWLEQFSFASSQNFTNINEFEVANICLVSKYMAKAIIKREKNVGAHFVLRRSDEQVTN